jgi:predicted enzyme related to lactoylglutathione lyase
MILGLRTAIYPVTDLGKGKAWYGRALGIEPYFDEPFYVGFSVGGFELGLVPDGQAGTGGVAAYWGVADAVKEYARLIEMGAAAHEEVKEVGGGIKVGSVLDPFGNVFSIIENPHFDVEKVR